MVPNSNLYNTVYSKKSIPTHLYSFSSSQVTIKKIYFNFPLFCFIQANMYIYSYLPPQINGGILYTFSFIFLQNITIYPGDHSIIVQRQWPSSFFFFKKPRHSTPLTVCIYYVDEVQCFSNHLCGRTSFFSYF